VHGVKNYGVFLQLHPADIRFVDAHFWYSFINSINRAERTSTRAKGPISFTLERRYNDYKYANSNVRYLTVLLAST